MLSILKQHSHIRIKQQRTEKNRAKRNGTLKGNKNTFRVMNMPIILPMVLLSCVCVCVCVRESLSHV